MKNINYHEIIRPIFSQSFFEKMLDLWQGRAAGHLGAEMYQDHAGQREGSSMSGVSTWVDYEKNGTLPKRNKALFAAVMDDLSRYIEPNLPVIEFGPGGMKDALRLLQSSQASEYIPVDCSLALLGQAREFANRKGQCPVRPAIIDFFSDDNCSLVDGPALSVLLGGTIANIPGPIPRQKPHAGLVRVMKNLMRAVPHGGHFLVSTDVSQDDEETKAYYSELEHANFGVNHLYRMAAELPVEGFDPDGFIYEPVWHPHCQLLAHTIRATKRQKFVMGTEGMNHISVNEGDVFHCNSSYRFDSSFFETCAYEAGLDIEHVWQEQGTIRMYLFKVPDLEMANDAYVNLAAHQSVYAGAPLAANQLASMQADLRLCG